MRVGQFPLGSGYSGSNATSYTLSIAPTPNRLQLVAVLSSRTGNPGAPSLSGNNLTWVQIANVAIDADTRLTVWRAMGVGSTSGNLTASFGGTQEGCAIMVSEFSGVPTGGTNGSQAVVQVQTGTGTGVFDLSMTFAAGGGGKRHAVYAAFGATSAQAITPGTHFTEIHDGTHATPDRRGESQWRDIFTMSTTATLASGTANMGGVMVEIRAAPDETGSVRRVLVADRAGRMLVELKPSLGSVIWRLNNISKVQFAVSRKDAKSTASNLAFGNLLYIEFDNGLPPWAGVIDPPRRWEGGAILLTAYSAEYILGLRRTGKARYFTAAPVGQIFALLVMEANAAWNTNLQLGNVWPGAEPHWPEYHFASLLKIVQEDIGRRMATADFAILPSLVEGRVVLTAELYEQRGTRRNDVVLIQGHNAEIVLEEQGPIVNSWDIAGGTIVDESGQSDGWGDERLTAHAEDIARISENGLREDALVLGNVLVQETLNITAANQLALSKEPKKLLSVKAFDLAPALFASYDVGDTVRVMAHNIGFGEGLDVMVRVMAREYSPADGSCALVVQQELASAITGALLGAAS